MYGSGSVPRKNCLLSCILREVGATGLGFGSMDYCYGNILFLVEQSCTQPTSRASTSTAYTTNVEWKCSTCVDTFVVLSVDALRVRLCPEKSTQIAAGTSTGNAAMWEREGR